MTAWVVGHPWAAGAVMLLLMWGDWVLTILQERERVSHYKEHYESYPVNTIEGNPLLQVAAARRRLVEPRYLFLALIFSAIVGYAIVWIPPLLQQAFVGFAWGLYLVALVAHFANLIDYRTSRRGVRGHVAVHLRTAYVVQAGRHLSLTILLVIVAVLTASLFAAGLALAALTVTARQYLWMRRIAPEESSEKKATPGTEQRPPE